ncbi:hypothetical protein [Xenorhabdus taiwanensis]|uniref:hypothetical protein n=1 Tax=Xenorhabdus taiwanensis TaxID=3085177 RepID=UPI0035A67EDE
MPEIVHGILSRIWPLALSPIPPTTIVQFTPTDDEHQGTAEIPISTSVSASLNVMWFNDFGHRHRGDILTSIIQQVT